MKDSPLGLIDITSLDGKISSWRCYCSYIHQ